MLQLNTMILFFYVTWCNVTFGDFDRYADGMERNNAARVLENFKDGTYLIRKSTNPKHMGDFALSIKYELLFFDHSCQTRSIYLLKVFLYIFRLDLVTQTIRWNT